MSDTRLVTNATLELLIDGGDGIWRTSGVGTEPMHLMNVPPKDVVMQCGDAPKGSKLWGVSSFQLQMGETGTARFGLRLTQAATAMPFREGGEGRIEDVMLELRKIGAAVIGTGWDRLFAQPTSTTGTLPNPPCTNQAQKADSSTVTTTRLLAEAAQVNKNGARELGDDLSLERQLAQVQEEILVASRKLAQLEEHLRASSQGTHSEPHL